MRFELLEYNRIKSNLMMALIYSGISSVNNLFILIIVREGEKKLKIKKEIYRRLTVKKTYQKNVKLELVR